MAEVRDVDERPVPMQCNTMNFLEASDGEQAVQVARRESPDLILLDVVMPEMDGYSTLAVLKSDLLPKKSRCLCLPPCNMS
jgi:CheY-like chemotaxis protein